ncbi:MAG: ribonuclease H-like YkuK family protein [bacterium]|nr:ribonuclease H-like YkuK family protein [bacterium]
MVFHNPTIGTLVFDQVVDELCAFLRADPNARYSVTIGSDSEQHGRTVEFISAIVIHRRGHGARYFWMRTEKPPFPNLRERIWHEAVLSTTLARSVLDALTERDAWWSDIEVHMDVGVNGPTKDLIREISGFVRAYGFIVCIKPDSYAASAVADRYI